MSNDAIHHVQVAVKSLLETREQLGGSFCDNDENWGTREETGLVSSIQGMRGVLGAFVALANDRASTIGSILEPHWKSLTDEWRNVLNEIAENGFHADPYDDQNTLKRVLAENPSQGWDSEPFLDTVSWFISAAILFNRAASIRSAESGQVLDSEMIDTTKERLADSIRLLLDMQREDGGWGWALSADSSSLYFSWSAMQALADIDDYILGGSEAQLGFGPDVEIVDWLAKRDATLVDHVLAARDKVTAHLAEMYLDKAIRNELQTSDIYDGGRLVPFDAENDLVMVYFEMYLLEALIIGSYDEPGGRTNSQRRKKLEGLYKTITLKMPRIRDEIVGLDEDAAAEKTTLRISLKGTKQQKGKVPEYTFQDPGLWPQYLRTLILYRYYTSPLDSVDADILGDRESALELLLGDRRSTKEEVGPGLWDNLAFNLNITVRAIESLVDAYDYINHLDQQASVGKAPATPSSGLAEMLADAVYPALLDRFVPRDSPEQPSAVAPSPSDDLLRKLREDVNKSVTKGNFASKLAESAFDIECAMQEHVGISPDLVLEDLLGKRAADHLKLENEDAYSLVRAVVWIAFNVSSRLLDRIVQEAVLMRFKDDDSVEKFRRFEGEPLYARIGALLEKLGELETEASIDRKIDPPDYADLVRGLGGNRKTKK